MLCLGIPRGFYSTHTDPSPEWICLGGKNKRLMVFINQALIKICLVEWGDGRYGRKLSLEPESFDTVQAGFDDFNPFNFHICLNGHHFTTLF